MAGHGGWGPNLAAAAICVLGVGLAFWLMRRAPLVAVGRRKTVLATACLTGGLTVWTTHFVAMQGYDAGVPLRYDMGLTVASLFGAVGFIGAAATVAVSGPGRLRLTLGALIGLSGVAAMHLVGIAALRMPADVTWSLPILAATVAAVLLLGLLVGRFYRPERPAGLPLVVLAGTAAILILHHGAMAAMTLTPWREADAVSGVPILTMQAVMAVLVGLIAGAAGLVAWLGHRSRGAALLHLREAIEALPDGLGFYDARDQLLVWNSRYAEINPEVADRLRVGMPFREVLEIGLDAGVYPEARGRRQAWMDERLAQRARLASSEEQPLGDGRWLRVQDRRTAEGGVLTVCNDITAAKADAIALAEARDAAEAANRAKSEFLANMSHEIRTPLNGVIGLTQALARTPLDDAQREMLELIQSSGRTLQTLLSDILDLARVESGRLELADEAFDLARAVAEAGQLYAASAAEKGLQFFVEVQPEAAVWVRGDAVRLKQVLTNLVSNAVKFTPSGFVSLTVARGLGTDGADRLRFTVEDTGIGFDRDARERLFTRFEQADGAITRRFGGTGLGLAICRQLAGLMGGELDCESEPGGGSAFILTLPTRPAPAPVVLTAAPCDVAAPTPRAHDRAGPRVLVADDHPTNRKVVELILAQSGVAVEFAADGAEALAAARLATYDLILMDMQMPVMDGLTATREIRLFEATHGAAPARIVMLTANALPEHVAAALDAGADGHLAKPFNAADLLALAADAAATRAKPAPDLAPAFVPASSRRRPA